MDVYRFDRGQVAVAAAWSRQEIRAGVASLLAHFAHRLPADPAARVVIKPNLNNDLVALTGNSVDLRVVDAVLAELRQRGYRDLTVADGSNVGVERRGIDTFARLKVDRLAARHGARVVDLNRDEGERVVLHAGARPRVARTVLHADFLLNLAKVKTHAEAGLSCALKNWVGITRGQEKRQMHYDLARNIFALGEVVVPDLVLVDGLVGMDGNGPGDGDPVRLGRLLASDDPFVNDVVVSRLVGIPWQEVPYLVHAHAAGRIDDTLLRAVSEEVPVLLRFRRPPTRSALNRLASSPRTLWFKRLLRPLTDRPAVAALAHRFGVIQDVYTAGVDTTPTVRRARGDCGGCEKCADFCPTALSAAEIGVRTEPDACIGCLYCWFVCPDGAIALDGPLLHLERQATRYKHAIEEL